MDLGRGFHSTKGNPHTSSVLYAIIIISALIILAAVPMLLRARRITRDAPAASSAGSPARTVSARAISNARCGQGRIRDGKSFAARSEAPETDGT